MQTIAVIQQKGGAGKTTLTTNIAAAAHLDGLRTLVLDTDAQGSALDWYHAREDGSPLDGLNVVRFERALTLRKLDELARGYDLVVIDTPAKLIEQSRNAAVLADVALIPMEPAYFNMWALDFQLAQLDAADVIRQQFDRAPLVRRLVLNKADARTNVTKEARAQAEALPGYLGDIHLLTAFVVASGFGESVLTAEPDGKAATEIRALWAQLKPSQQLATVAAVGAN